MRQNVGLTRDECAQDSAEMLFVYRDMTIDQGRWSLRKFNEGSDTDSATTEASACEINERRASTRGTPSSNWNWNSSPASGKVLVLIRRSRSRSAPEGVYGVGVGCAASEQQTRGTRRR